MHCSATLDVIGLLTATQEEVTSAGLSLLSCIYDGKSTNSFNYLHYTSYYRLTTSGTSAVLPERLAPTVNAAKFHILQAHLQALWWKTLMSTSAVPTDWGWKLHDGHFVPIATVIPVAPDNIRNAVCFKCHISSQSPCRTMLCSCRNHGLECVTACKNSPGTDCENVKVDSQLLCFCDTPTEPDEDLELFIPWIIHEII